MAGLATDKAEGRPERRGLVRTAAARLREIILEREPGAPIGSLNEVSELLGVGIVTVQQAARVLEHEGLLDVRRGPGGGYYGARPDSAALERGLGAYMRVHGSGRAEAREIVTLMDCELASLAAACVSAPLRDELAALGARVDECDTPDLRVAWHEAFRVLLFKMVERPLFELISRVSMQVYEASAPQPLIYVGEDGVATWKVEQKRIVEAILQHDGERARFEAERHRNAFLRRIRASESVDEDS